MTVLTYGETSKFLYAQDSLYSVEDLWSPFTADKCLSLAGKPKIFIIQACRGERLDPGVTVKQGTERRTETDSIHAAYKIPTQADFLIAYSSVEGT
jgi:caspase-like apoptosis-related cysteine protease